MEIEITEEQELLREMSARFIESNCPLVAVREFMDDKRGITTDYLTQTAELGWYSLLVSEEYGGGQVSESGISDAAIVAEERGRLVQPGAFISSNLVALAISEFGSEDQRSSLLPDLMAGASIATWATADTSGNWDLGAGVTATRSENGVVLDGTKGLVQDAHIADSILVTANLNGSPIHLIVPAASSGVTVKPLESLDITRRFGRITFEQAEFPLELALGFPDDGIRLWERLTDVAAVLTVAESVGALSYLFDMVVEYSKDRWAFGRPIGSFQSIKHTLANTGLLLEMCRAMSAAATRAVAGNDDSASEVASMAKAFVGKNCIEASHECFQVFGGIGYTWEHDQHLYFRRLAVDAALFGEPAWHRERICKIHQL